MKYVNDDKYDMLTDKISKYLFIGSSWLSN